MSSWKSRLTVCALCRRHGALAALLVAILTGSACSEAATPVEPTKNAIAPAALNAHALHNGSHAEDKGYIDGWFDGREVQLHYTKSYFCAEPPSSGAPSDCEIGAPAEVAPRPGPIPTIYAIAAVGFSPDPATLACAAGSPCLNHPAMIDASRIGGPASALALSHSHILDARGGGWFHTVTSGS